VKNPDLPEALWRELDGRLWHATDHHGLSGILSDRAIRVAVGNRYTHSVCRNLGCISLFDFGPDAYDQDEFLRSNWYGWLGSEHKGRCAIWLEIDRELSRDRLIGPMTLIQTKREKEIRGIFFCGVEACHQGPIALDAIVGAVLIDRYDPSLVSAKGSRSR
jgi:hypothetical protein